LIQGVTRFLKDVLGKNPATTVVVIDEIATDNWDTDGKTVRARVRRGADKRPNYQSLYRG
jgi:4-oxalocrotonate tautomerase